MKSKYLLIIPLVFLLSSCDKFFEGLIKDSVVITLPSDENSDLDDSSEHFNESTNTSEDLKDSSSKDSTSLDENSSTSENVEHEHIFTNYINSGYYHEASCDVEGCSYVLFEKCDYSNVIIDEIEFSISRKCDLCNSSFNEELDSGDLTLEYSVSNDKNVLTIYSDKDSYINYSKIFDANIIGSKVADSQIDELIIGSNIVNVKYLPKYSNVSKITFSEDILKLKPFIIYNFTSLTEITFEGDAPCIELSSLTINGGNEVIINTTSGASGFDSLLFGGHILEKNIPEKVDISSVSIDEYGVTTAKESSKIAKRLVEKAKNENKEYMLYYPYENDIGNYSLIKDFTLQLTKDCVSEDEKIKKIYDYITTNIVYSDEDNTNSPYDVFIENRAVCAGYVVLMHDMLAAVKIPSYYSRGATLETLKNANISVDDIIYSYDYVNNFYETHAWLTVVKSNGEVSHYDPTWGRMNSEAYYNLDDEQLGKHVVTYETDFLEIYASDVNFSMINSICQYFAEDNKIYNVNFGNISQLSTAGVYNYIICPEYMSITANDGWVSTTTKELTKVYDSGIIYNGNGDVFLHCKYANYDGRCFDIQKVLTYLNYENVPIENVINSDMFVFKDDMLFFKNVNNTYSLVTYVGLEKEVNIPSTINDVRVTTILNGAFKDNKTIEVIKFSEGIEIVIGNAFVRCYNLETIILPNSLKEFAVSNIYYSESGQVFEYCNNLKSIYLESNDNYVSIDGVLYTKDKKELVAYPANKSKDTYNIVEGVEFIHNYAFNAAKCREVILPKSLKEIGTMAFSYSEIENINIPSNCAIGYQAFYYATHLRTVFIEDGIEEMGAYAFANCQSLISIMLPQTLKSISECCFLGCLSLYNIYLHNGIEEIEYMAFAEAGLVTITLPTSLKHIGEEAFYCCDRLLEIYNFSSLVLTKESNEHGSIAFNAMDIYTSNDSSKIIIQDEFVFYGNILIAYIGNGETEIILPSNINGEEYVLGEKLFYGEYIIGWAQSLEICYYEYPLYHPTINLTKVVIPDFISSLPDLTFAGCINLKEISASTNLVGFGLNCLGGVKLEKVYLNGDPTQYNVPYEFLFLEIIYQ